LSPGILFAGYLIVTLLPLGLAAAGARPPRSVWDELASGAGMLAFSIMLTEFVLSGRFRSISGRIGMDLTMRLHQLLGRTALVLVLIHPFLYETSQNPSVPWDPTRQVTIAGDLEALIGGILAWILLPSLVLLAIGRTKGSYRYETWRVMHGIGALAVAALVLHHTLSAGRYAADPLLAGVWIVLFAIAMLSLVWVYAVEPVLQARRPWSVSSVRRLADRVWELEIEPEGHRGVDYEAGQFVWLNVGRSSFSTCENPFSISSAPASGPALQFIIKELGDFTSTVGQIRPGTRAYVDGPHGTLTVAGRAEPGIRTYRRGCWSCAASRHPAPTSSRARPAPLRATVRQSFAGPYPPRGGAGTFRP
jgi:predicted ferric reductase